MNDIFKIIIKKYYKSRFHTCDWEFLEAEWGTPYGAQVDRAVMCKNCNKIDYSHNWGNVRPK